MRIQNNIMAMNTHRMYTNNNNNIQKSAEKLSSGYRINRAGDDAAGLAISEKMRSQIRGLNMASKNSQDAISLVQTAEGALQEVHSMLQRMNELAVQSATGTNQEFDRLQLAKEFGQLKREINDISEQTTFNNMKILDGSLSSEGPVRSAATAGIVSTVSTDDSLSAINSIASTKGLAAVTASTAEFTVDISGATVDLATGDTVTMKIGDLEITSDAAAAAVTDGSDLGALFDGKTVSIEGVEYTIANTDGELKFTASGDLDSKPPVDDTVVQFKVNGASGSSVSEVKVTASAVGAAEVIAKPAETTFNVDFSTLQAGDVLNINGTEITFVNQGDTGSATYAIELPLDSTDPQTDFATKLQTHLAAANPDGTVVVDNLGGTGDTGSFRIQFQALAAGPADTDVLNVNFKPAGGAATTSTIEFDVNKLRDGDVVSVQLGGKEYTTTYNKGDSIEDTVNNLMASDGTMLMDLDGAVYKTNSLRVKGEADVSGFVPAPLNENEFGTMRIQVGALENEQLNIEVKSMNTAGLKLDAHDLTSQDSAGMAITATRNAVNIVSEQRALLGAMQNRLEHKISNLDNTAENLQAAESRIRDVDIAKEMTNFTKNNILAQASTAMLAQANAAPQGVLSLLQ